MASLLLSNGAGPSHKAAYLDTPLHLACLLGHGAVVALLLENGADPSALDEDGKVRGAAAAQCVVHVCLEEGSACSVSWYLRAASEHASMRA